ncbi:unnamed protein product, partial [Phaeothamnion confervicola]
MLSAQLARDGQEARPLNLVCVFGPARAGKSTLLNLFQDSTGTFTVSGSADPCTQGVDVSSTIFGLQDFLHAGGADTPANSGQHDQTGPLIGFVDAEGSGDRHESYELKLVTPVIIVSRVVVYNWKGLPNRATMLSSLAVLAMAAAAVDDSERSNAFGCLVILCRDVDPSEEENCGRKVMGIEDETAAEEDDGFGESEEAQAATKRRNNIRRQLQDAFATVIVKCLPDPFA